MAASKSSFSAGEIIYAVLTKNPEVSKLAGDIYPVVEDRADLPYIVYRRIGLEQTPVKSQRGSDSVAIEILCFTKGYTEGVRLAEAVRGALDGMQMSHEDLTIRACTLTDSEETWYDDAYVQQLIFNCKM